MLSGANQNALEACSSWLTKPGSIPGLVAVGSDFGPAACLGLPIGPLLFPATVFVLLPALAGTRVVASHFWARAHGSCLLRGSGGFADNIAGLRWPIACRG